MDSKIDPEQLINHLAAMGTDLSSSPTFEQLFERVMEHLGIFFSPSNWSILLIDEDSNQLEFSFVVGDGAEKLIGKRLERGVGVAGWIAQQGKSVIIPDTSKDKRFFPEFDSMIGFTTKSIIGVPIKVQDKVLGVMELINKPTGEEFTTVQLSLLEALASFIAIAVEKLHYIKSLRHMALTDPLTGLYNRRLFDSTIRREQERAKRNGHPISLMVIDIDNFKDINDTHGHGVGDEILVTLATILTQGSRKSDFLCRWGGDEFAIVSPGLSLEDATLLTERIKAHARDNSLFQKTNATISVGVHECSSGDPKEFFNQADAKMYQDKLDRIEANEFNILKDYEEEHRQSK